MIFEKNVERFVDQFFGNYISYNEDRPEKDAQRFCDEAEQLGYGIYYANGSYAFYCEEDPDVLVDQDKAWNEVAAAM